MFMALTFVRRGGLVVGSLWLRDLQVTYRGFEPRRLRHRLARIPFDKVLTCIAGSVGVDFKLHVSGQNVGFLRPYVRSVPGEIG